MNRKHRDRRSILLAGIAVGATAALGLDAPAAAAGAAPLSVHVTLAGTSYLFEEAKGRDLGDYQGPGFVQRCVMVTVPDLPLTVFLRPDRDSDRVEAVFELGRVWSGPPRHLGPYTVEIRRGEKSLARIDVPQHFWFSRWRWQSARRPIIAKSAALIAATLLPPLGLDHAERIHAAREPVDAVPQFRRAAFVPAAAQLVPDAGATEGLPPASSIIGTLRRGPHGEIEVVQPPPAPPPAHATSRARTPVPTRAASPQRARPVSARAMPQSRSAASAPSARLALQQSVATEPLKVQPYSIMGLAGITAYMPTTGDRQEIGALTEYQAIWICTGNRDALEEMLDQAEASGTVPWHIRDEKTGAPFNFEQYPKGGWTGDEPHLCHPYVAALKSPITPDIAHQPALTYVPFVFTGDPYYLEELQLQTTWCIGANAPEYRLYDKCILQHGQTRGYAWCLRDVAQAAKVTPAKVPGWLLPRDYWQRILDNNRQWFEQNFVRNPHQPFRVCRVAIKVRDGADDPILQHVPRTDPFEEEYFAFVLGWTALMFPAWRDAFVWKVGSTIARTDGKSGWVRAYATPYLLALRRSDSAPWPQTWKEVWDLNAELQKWVVKDPDRWAIGPTGYLTYSRAALGFAAHFGVPEAKECYLWADNQIRTASHQHSFWYRWNIPL